MSYRDQLRAIMDARGTVPCLPAIMNNPGLFKWVEEQSSSLKGTATLAERAYAVLNGINDQCANGNRKLFVSIAKGYKFCGKHCECRNTNQSEKMTEYHETLTDDQVSERLAKQEATLMATHQVSNPMHIPGSNDKIRETSLAVYGVEHFTQSPVVKATAVATNRIVYGFDYHTQSPLTQAKKIATNLERYNEKHTMFIAQAAFLDQTGYANPFSMAQYQELARKTMMERYGYEHALQVPEIFDKMIETVEKKWGYRNVLMVPAIQQKITETHNNNCGRNSHMQAHIPDEGWAILQDGDAFRKLFETMSLRQVAYHVGLSYDGARKYCDKYGVDLPKSTYETAVTAFLSEYGFSALTNNRKIIAPLELDFVIPEKKVAIEFCGLYWHGDKNKEEREYHRIKKNLANAAGYRLITIFEDEWIFNREICQMRLLNILGVSEKGIGARKSIVREIDPKTAGDFLDIYHVQGRAASSVRYGAFDAQDNLVAVMTFALKSRLALGQKNGPPELVRFATDGRNHPGIASKMFKAFVTQYNPTKVLSYADLRWSEGDLYTTMGFANMGETDVNYWYVAANKISRYHRYKFRKDQIIHLVEDGANKTEKEIMKELKYYRIYDCGSRRFIWTNPNTNKE